MEQIPTRKIPNYLIIEEKRQIYENLTDPSIGRARNLPIHINVNCTTTSAAISGGNESHYTISSEMN